jgi:glycosyltransferase involved in cell wall biosynthesis
MSHLESSLSICIPTFNRANLLDRLLTSINSEIQLSHWRVEITISDNASQDDTPKVVAKWIKRGLPIIYHRNMTNEGPDANMRQCFEMASGKFRWWIGDDDQVKSGAFDQVQRLIQIPNVIAIASRVIDPSQNKLALPETTFTHPHDFLLNGGSGISFGSLIVKAVNTHDGLQLDWGLGSYHYYACYLWGVLAWLGENKLPVTIIQCTPLIDWNFSREKWYMPRLWEIIYIRTRYYPDSLPHFYEPIKPQLRRELWLGLSSLDSAFNALRDADSKWNCINAITTYPMPLIYKLRLIFWLTIRSLGVTVKSIFRLRKNQKYYPPVKPTN